MGNFSRVFIAVVLIISLFTVSVFATPTGTYDLYGTNGRQVYGYSGSGNDYISNFSGHLAHIRVYLDQILAYNSNISTTIDYYLPALLQRMVDAFSPAAGDTRSMWQLSSAMVSGITAIQSAALGIAQDVYSINTTSADIDRLAGLIHSDVDQVESQLSSVNVNLQSLENINWINNSDANFLYSYDNVNYYSFSDMSDPDISQRKLYVKISGDSYFNDSLIYISVPFWITNYYQDHIPEVKFYLRNFNNEIYPDYYIFSNFRSTSLFLFPYNYIGSYDFIMEFTFDTRIRISSLANQYFNYLNSNSVDFYTVDNFIQNHKQSEDSTLSDIKNILIDIDNNSDFIQNNNDLEINVDIDAADGQGVTAIILKLQDIFDFGVGLQEFLVTLNEFDNLHWFTSPETYNQVNQDPRFSPGYIDLYD